MLLVERILFKRSCRPKYRILSGVKVVTCGVLTPIIGHNKDLCTLLRVNSIQLVFLTSGGEFATRFKFAWHQH